MNGASADPLVKNIKAPKITKIKIKGINHHFFRSFIKRRNSLINSIYLTIIKFSITNISIPVFIKHL